MEQSTPCARGLSVGMMSIRVLSYSMLGYGLFYLAMCLGKWYSNNVFNSREDKFEYTIDGDVEIGNFYNQIVVFAMLPVILSAALGGVYECLWKKRDDERSGNDGAQHSTLLSWLDSWHNVVHYKFKPLAQYSPWLSVGEVTVLSLWLFAMAAQLWQGVHNHGGHYYEFVGRCPDDPSSWCNLFTGEAEPTPQQYRLRIVAIFFGLVASTHFAAILIPVSRDSKLWSAVGIPFERAVLYHAIIGHLAFASLLLHAVLFVIFWVWFNGWEHAWHESTHLDPDSRHGIDVPAGWVSFFCAMPMWITSVNYVRRNFYSLFKATHWLFIGVFLFGAMHWAPNVVFFLGGLSLYTVHIVSRLSSWKRWRFWNRVFGSSDNANPTSLLNVRTTSAYTRLVLKNPKSEPAKGGTFVYLAVPGALGTDEAHAITVALRGAPSGTTIKNLSNDDVFTVYIKNLGRWTAALNLTAKGAEAPGSPESLLVDVDGFYNHTESFRSMLADGIERVVAIAGGSGLTSFMGFIQDTLDDRMSAGGNLVSVCHLLSHNKNEDWCVAASEGRPVPQVHLAWCCRDMAELELVGESLPSLLASAGAVKDTHFTATLYCSAKGIEAKEDLSVTWPLENDAQTSTNSSRNQWASIEYSLRILVAAGAAYCGWLLGTYEAARRDMLESLHEGAIALTLVIITIVSALVVYDWISYFIKKSFTTAESFAKTQVAEESKHDLEATAVTATFPVRVGRVPTAALLADEARKAKVNGWKAVKVMVSGPNALVDAVVADARGIDWQLFQTEVFSFEF